MALALIGGITLWISESATLFGCLVGLHPACTAITIVALGTSLPDAFTSRSAAANNPTADTSITNITGSNCVNVFLGLGLPLCARTTIRLYDYTTIRLYNYTNIRLYKYMTIRLYKYTTIRLYDYTTAHTV